MARLVKAPPLTLSSHRPPENLSSRTFPHQIRKVIQRRVQRNWTVRLRMCCKGDILGPLLHYPFRPAETTMSSICKFALYATLFTLMGTAAAQQNSDPRVADLVRAGKVRIGLFSTQFTKDAATGELRGVRPDIARALAARIGVQAVLLEHGGPPQVIECLKQGACDVVFLPKDARAVSIGDFSFPFIQSEFTFLVQAGSAIRRASDADKQDIRIAAVRGHASTAALISVVKQAQVVLEEGEQATFELLRSGRVHAFASTRQFLGKVSGDLPGSQVLADRYGAQFNRVVVPKGHATWLTYANEFVEEAKRSGLVQKAIDREGTNAFQVAPMGESE
jgi:polar amino acid transport system substrate-binding protein